MEHIEIICDANGLQIHKLFCFIIGRIANPPEREFDVLSSYNQAYNVVLCFMQRVPSFFKGGAGVVSISHLIHIK